MYTATCGNGASIGLRMIYSDTFGRNDFWTVTNYFNRLGIEVNGRIKGICINGPTNQCDTAWSATSSIIPLKGNGQRYRLSFCIGATMAIKMPNNDGEDWRSTILWYGVGGKVILKSPITYSAPKSGHTLVVMHGDIPEGAVSFSLKFGFDKPDIGLANRLMFSDLSFEEMPISPSYAAEAEFVSEVHEGGVMSSGVQMFPMDVPCIFSGADYRLWGMSPRSHLSDLTVQIEPFSMCHLL